MTDIISVLERARQYELETGAQLEHIERLHRIMKRPQTNRSYAEKTVEKLARLEEELNRSIDLAADAKLEALGYINKLQGEERGVIEYYYILGYTWEKIADKMYMSDRRVFLIRKRALQRLERLCMKMGFPA